jgi:hypothetical protein
MAPANKARRERGAAWVDSVVMGSLLLGAADWSVVRSLVRWSAAVYDAPMAPLGALSQAWVSAEDALTMEG